MGHDTYIPAHPLTDRVVEEVKGGMERVRGGVAERVVAALYTAKGKMYAKDHKLMASLVAKAAMHVGVCMLIGAVREEFHPHLALSLSLEHVRKDNLRELKGYPLLSPPSSSLLFLFFPFSLFFSLDLLFFFFSLSLSSSCFMF